MLVLRELTIYAILARMACATIMGGLIGLERGMKNRPAGLRTYMLVSLGACAVMITNQYVTQMMGAGDPMRMGAQVISGIGFLGAGTIIVTSRNQIKGLTTAAGLWAAACIGLATGIGLYEVAIPGGVGIFLIMTALNKLDVRVRKATRMADVYVELDKGVSMGKFLRYCRDHDIETSNLQIEQEHDFDQDLVTFIITVRGRKHQKHEALIALLRQMDGLRYLEEL